MVRNGRTRSESDEGWVRPLEHKSEAWQAGHEEDFFSLRVIDSWNQIPSDMKRIVKCENFRAAYKMLRAAQLRRA